MVYEDAFLARVEAVAIRSLDLEAWRFTIGNSPPERPNVRGARWNPPDVSALYLNTAEEGAIAEGNHFLDMLPIVPRGQRRVHRVHVVLERVLDFPDIAGLAVFGINEAVLRDTPDGYPPCRKLGGAAAFLDRQGLLLPSVHLPGARNLVVFTDQIIAGGVCEVDVLTSRDLP